MGAVVAWFASVGEDLALLTGEYLPEILLVSFALVIVWVIRSRIKHNARPNS